MNKKAFGLLRHFFAYYQWPWLKGGALTMGTWGLKNKCRGELYRWCFHHLQIVPSSAGGLSFFIPNGTGSQIRNSSSWGFPGGSDGKASACNAGVPCSIPGSGRSPGEGNGNPLQQLLPGKSHGRRSLIDYSLWSHKESDTTEWLHFHFQTLINKTRNLV